MQYKEYPVWKMLSSFPFDAPNSIETFPDRLTRLGGWDPEQTQLIINEYKRFLFLCATKEYMIVPSKAIDMAWSIHMEYYPLSFRQLCQFIPVQNIRREKFYKSESDDDQWIFTHYMQTKVIYVETFFEKAPVSVWGMYEDEFEEHFNVIVNLGKDKTVSVDARIVCVFPFALGAALSWMLSHWIPVTIGALVMIIALVTHPVLNDNFRQTLDGKGFRAYLHRAG